MKVYPSWKSNLSVFAVLTLLVAGYFFWQVRHASTQFREQSKEHSKVLATVVELNIRNALLSDQGFAVIVGSFLESSARFILYLQSVEPFTSSELSVFAAQSGLTWIGIVQEEGQKIIAVPQDMGLLAECREPGTLRSLPDEHLYLYSFKENPLSSKAPCVVVGLSTKKIEAVKREVSVDNLLKVLNTLRGIAYVRLEKAERVQGARKPGITTMLLKENGRRLSKSRFSLGEYELIVALDAGHFGERMQQIRKQFALFVVFLVLIGLLSSWWLFRMQKLRIRQAQEFERKLARQHEEAALGRAAEVITHEMRNPLNAIGMGLQRLQIEAENLEGEHRDLIISMRDAVERSNSIISGLTQYSHSFHVAFAPLVLAECIINVIELYKPSCDEQNIQVELDLDENITVLGDKRLLGQVLENVIKNSVEAQPDGGVLHILMGRTGGECEIVVANGETLLVKDEENKVFEPYFTSKTKGTGLGLAISKKIVEAHKGHLSCQIDEKSRMFRLFIHLPLLKGTEQ